MSWIVESRCAMATVVRPRISTSSASRMTISVSVSTLDVASSSTSTGRSNASARANESSCFCPTDSDAPRSPSTVSHAGRQLVDEPVGSHRRGRARHVRVVEPRLAQPDVRGDGAGEQVHVLQHEAEQRPHVLERELADVDRRPPGCVPC